MLPLCLSIEIRVWLADFIKESPSATWNDFKAAIKLQYGITQDAEQEVATTDLLTLQMSSHQTIESFIDKFQDLKRRAGLSAPSVLCPRFVSALPIHLSEQMTIALASAPGSTKRNLFFIMSLAKELYNKLNIRTRRVNSMHAESSSSVARVDKLPNNRSRSYQHGRNFVRDPASPTSSDAPISNQEFCSFHNSYGTHSTDSCRAFKATQANPSGSGTSTTPPRSNPSCR